MYVRAVSPRQPEPAILPQPGPFSRSSGLKPPRFGPVDELTAGRPCLGGPGAVATGAFLTVTVLEAEDCEKSTLPWQGGGGSCGGVV
jgi:hypothetical protein